MTRLLLSVSDTLKKQLTPDKQEAILRNTFNFFYAVQALRLFTFVWLYWTINKYQFLRQRPSKIFWYDHALPSLVMPALPAPLLFYTVVALVAACNLYQLLRQKNHTLCQALLALGLLWLNLALWGYGFLSHINHLYLLAHLLLTFIPLSKKSLPHASVYLHQNINWFYAGLLFTYTLSGLWKIPSLLYKLITNSGDIHWLHPQAALVNAVVGHRSLDLDFTLAPLFTEYVLFWQVSFLVVLYIQSASIFTASRQPTRPWMGLLLLIFHTVNMLFFQIYFVVASVAIICLFMPYNLLFSKKYKATFSNVSDNAAAMNEDNETTASPFEKYRTKLNSKSYYLSGLLYMPGLRTLANLLTRLTRR
ncbi:hypothetical protein ABID22_002354 [Pontibacter aydingkolensis]|uniref:Vitamin K-dependent gamma-carboxylase n=1 Tax=Pontibacter aydingkolensis TaxID=1911536 RepID=A0ABS7CVZ1_9BACT|nr:hypothetical protein [Pontibacter aydingkolensis]MBW7467955.1 hypothetical protein [Pontibacter aydingkolensis]